MTLATLDLVRGRCMTVSERLSIVSFDDTMRFTRVDAFAQHG